MSLFRQLLCQLTNAPAQSNNIEYTHYMINSSKVASVTRILGIKGFQRLCGSNDKYIQLIGIRLLLLLTINVCNRLESIRKLLNAPHNERE